MELKIVDDNKVVWLWDGERLRTEGSDEEFIADGVPLDENGYQAETFDEVVKVLKYGDFIGNSTRCIYRVDYWARGGFTSAYFAERQQANDFAREMNANNITVEWLKEAFDVVPLDKLMLLLERDSTYIHHTVTVSATK